MSVLNFLNARADPGDLIIPAAQRGGPMTVLLPRGGTLFTFRIQSGRLQHWPLYYSSKPVGPDGSERPKMAATLDNPLRGLQVWATDDLAMARS
jgi:hypothetical protein